MSGSRRFDSCGEGRDRGRIFGIPSGSVSWRAGLIGFKALDSHERTHSALVSSILRSPSFSLSSSFSFFFFLRRDPGGRKEYVGHVHSSHGEEYNVNYLAARSGSSARERASGHARTSLIELLTRVCVRRDIERAQRPRREISGAVPKLTFLDHVISLALLPFSGTCHLSS